MATAGIATRTGKARARRLSPATRRNLRNGLLFISPWLLGLLIFTLYPLVMTVYYGFTDFDGLTFPPHWRGLGNYVTLFTRDPEFWPAVANTIWWAVFSVPLGVIAGVLLALLLNLRVRGIGVYRTLFYMPSLVPAVGSSLLFLWMFNPGGGLINGFLGALGLGQPGWFSDPLWAKPALLIQSLWGVGGGMIIYLAGLKDIPKELYEAAAIDGANALRQLRHITLPMLTPTIFFNLVLGTINAFSFFVQALVVSSTPASLGGGGGDGVTNVGGPVDSTLLYSVYVYQQIFGNFQFGYAAAMSCLLTIVVLLLTGIIFGTARRWVFYGGETR
ncbi:MAG TPA: sugar ABC transporter permease [Chloroflexota bacterium]|nr:sugar ABC transporter permease [Chloroflexota bacterium]